MNAIALAHKNDINVAVSNECFELWFLLHFGLVTTRMNRKDFLNKLDDHFSSSFNCKYSKMMDNTYELLKPYQDDAIRNAKKLHDKQNNDSVSYYWNPYTSVFKLIVDLNKNIRN